MTAPTDKNLIQMTADIVQRHVRSHKLSTDALTKLITGVHHSLHAIAHPTPTTLPVAKRTPTPKIAPTLSAVEQITDPPEIFDTEEPVLGEIKMGADGELIFPPHPAEE